MHVLSLGALRRLRIRHCSELWCRSQMWLGSRVAVPVAVAGSCSSDSTPSLGASVCCKCSPKKKKKKEEEELQREHLKPNCCKYFGGEGGGAERMIKGN